MIFEMPILAYIFLICAVFACGFLFGYLYVGDTQYRSLMDEYASIKNLYKPRSEYKFTIFDNSQIKAIKHSYDPASLWKKSIRKVKT